MKKTTKNNNIKFKALGAAFITLCSLQPINLKINANSSHNTAVTSAQNKSNKSLIYIYLDSNDRAASKIPVESTSKFNFKSSTKIDVTTDLHLKHINGTLTFSNDYKTLNYDLTTASIQSLNLPPSGGALRFNKIGMDKFAPKNHIKGSANFDDVFKLNRDGDYYLNIGLAQETKATPVTYTLVVSDTDKSLAHPSTAVQNAHTFGDNLVDSNSNALENNYFFPEAYASGNLPQYTLKDVADKLNLDLDSITDKNGHPLDPNAVIGKDGIFNSRNQNHGSWHGRTLEFNHKSSNINIEEWEVDNKNEANKISKLSNGTASLDHFTKEISKLSLNKKLLGFTNPIFTFENNEVKLKSFDFDKNSNYIVAHTPWTYDSVSHTIKLFVKKRPEMFKTIYYYKDKTNVIDKTNWSSSYTDVKNPNSEKYSIKGIEETTIKNNHIKYVNLVDRHVKQTYEIKEFVNNKMTQNTSGHFKVDINMNSKEVTITKIDFNNYKHLVDTKTSIFSSIKDFITSINSDKNFTIVKYDFKENCLNIFLENKNSESAKQIEKIKLKDSLINNVVKEHNKIKNVVHVKKTNNHNDKTSNHKNKTLKSKDPVEKVRGSLKK